MKIAIATSSPEKIGGIIKAFSRFFNLKEPEIEAKWSSVCSGVAEQPFNEETYQGVLNRVNGIKSVFPGMDFYISCEAGIESVFNQYFNVQVVCIFKADTNTTLFGKSAGWSIPAEEINMVKRDTLDTYLRGKGLTCIQELLGPENSRRQAVAQATELALASGRLKNNLLYKIFYIIFMRINYFGIDC